MNPNQNQDPNQNQNPSQYQPQQVPQPQQPVVPPVDPTYFEQHDYTHPIADPPKHRYHPKRFKIILSVIVVVSILAVALMLLFALLPPSTSKKSEGTSPTNTKSSKTAQSLTAAMAIKHVQEYFKGTEQAKSPLLYPVQAPQMAYFTVVPDTTPLVSVADEVAQTKAKTQLDAIVHSLSDDILAKTVISDGTKGTNYQAYFTGSTVTCEVDQLAPTDPKDPKATVHTEAKCLDLATYSQYAAAQQPLVSLYVPLSATSVQYGFVGKPNIVPASTAGYKRTRLEVSNVIDHQLTSSGQFALYYQSPDGLWHYFADQDHDVPLDCTLYKTKDLHSAYSGTPCLKVTTGVTTTVDPPRPGSY